MLQHAYLVLLRTNCYILEATMSYHPIQPYQPSLPFQPCPFQPLMTGPFLLLHFSLTTLSLLRLLKHRNDFRNYDHYFVPLQTVTERLLMKMECIDHSTIYCCWMGY